MTNCDPLVLIQYIFGHSQSFITGGQLKTNTIWWYFIL